MSRKERLDLLCLLSRLESWSFAANHRMPDHLLEDLDNAKDQLKTEILGEEVSNA